MLHKTASLTLELLTHKGGSENVINCSIKIRVMIKNRNNRDPDSTVKVSYLNIMPFQADHYITSTHDKTVGYSILIFPSIINHIMVNGKIFVSLVIEML